MWAAIAAWFVVVGEATVTAVWGACAAAIATAVAFFGTWPAALYAVMVIVIGINLYNLACGCLQEILNWALTQLNTVSPPGGMPSSGLAFLNLAGYLATQLKFPQCLSFIFNIIALKWMIVKVPFLKW